MERSTRLRSCRQLPAMLKTNSIMNTPTTALTPATPPVALEANWESVRRWADWATKFERGSLACQVMAGFGLLGLHEQYVARPQIPGRSVSHDGTRTFKKLLIKELSISRTTAYRWMDMAKALRARYGDMTAPERMRTLLAVSPKDWTPGDSKLVQALVDQVTDGKTALGFLKEIGVTQIKKRAALPAPALAASKVIDLKTAAAQWTSLQKQLHRYGKAYEVLGEESVQQQIVELASAVNVRQTWLENRLKARPAA